MEKRKKRKKAENMIERMTREAFDDAIRNVRKSTGSQNAARVFDLSGGILRRRRAATCRLFPEVCQRFGALYTEDELAFAWATECAVTGHSIDGIDHLYYITLAAAIFILDELKHSGKLDAALHYLDKPQADAVDMEEVLPLERFDPCHDEVVIRSMIDLIRERNPRGGRYQHYMTDTTARCTEPIQYQLPEEAGADLTPRERFNAVMSMIHPAVKEQAVKRFEAKFWEFLGIYFSCDAPLCKEYTDCIKRSEELMDECDQLQSRMLSQFVPATALDQKGITGKPMPDLLPAAFPAPLSGQKAPGVKAPLLGHQDRLHRMALQGLNCEQMAENLDEQRLELLLMSSVASMRPYEELVERVGKENTEQLLRLEVDDPYETCFALLCLLEEGSDIPWAYSGAVAVLTTAARKLPWNALALDRVEALRTRQPWGDETDLDEEEEQDAPMEVFQQEQPVDWHERKAELYRLNYQNSPLYNAPSEAPSQNWKLNLPQLLFGLTGLIMPRTVSDQSGMAEELTAAGMESGLAKGMELYLQLAQDIQLQSRFQVPDLAVEPRGGSDAEQPGETAEGAREDVDKLRLELRQLKEANANYREALYQAQRDLERVKKDMEGVEAQAAEERAELSALRELVFQQSQKEQLSDEPEQEPPAAQQFPYRTKKRIVVFGGHETWLKAIRPLLPNVTFINRIQSPNADMIRAADVVWIQANAIPHRNYYKIIHVVRANHVPVRYFGYASAMKCAMQVVEDDHDAGKA